MKTLWIVEFMFICLVLFLTMKIDNALDKCAETVLQIGKWKWTHGEYV